MIAFKLAIKNLIGAGLRTWLNVFVLSLSYVIIIWYSGIIEGWNRQARRDTINWQVGGGQYWQENYDPYDPFTLTESHAHVPKEFLSLIKEGEMTPLLLSQGTIYPEGRMQSVMIKGIDPAQDILKIPSHFLKDGENVIPALIGKRMASSTHMKKGDFVTLRWRDVNGTFDAGDAEIMDIFDSTVPMVDNGQIWVPLQRLQAMTQMQDQATILVTAPNVDQNLQIKGWDFKGYDFLFQDLDSIIKSKNIGGRVFNIILLLLALLAIFDTQVFSVFRRQKEIGTDIALGMTRGQVIRLFTVEGAMHGVLAAIMGAVYGIPFLYYQLVKGFPLPENTDEFGLAVASEIYPYYSLGLIISTIIIIFVSVTIVSYIPTRKITKMNPTEAIRGKIQ